MIRRFTRVLEPLDNRTISPPVGEFLGDCLFDLLITGKVRVSNVNVVLPEPVALDSGIMQRRPFVWPD
jgi:hypothetical protein